MFWRPTYNSNTEYTVFDPQGHPVYTTRSKKRANQFLKLRGWHPYQLVSYPRASRRKKCPNHPATTTNSSPMHR